MRCCKVRKSVEKCFDHVSLYCAVLQKLREAGTGNFPWTEKNDALAKCRLGLRAGRVQKPLR